MAREELGSLGCHTLARPTLELPLPGAPEPLGRAEEALGCGPGSGPGVKSMGGIVDTITGLSTPAKLAAAAGVVGILYFWGKRKKR